MTHKGSSIAEVLDVVMLGQFKIRMQKNFISSIKSQNHRELDKNYRIVKTNSLVLKYKPIIIELSGL